MKLINIQNKLRIMRERKKKKKIGMKLKGN